MDSSTSINTYDRILKDLQQRSEKVISGKVNCIPFPFKRFREFLPGIEQGLYYLVTANQKVKLNNNQILIFKNTGYYYNLPKTIVILSIVHLNIGEALTSKVDGNTEAQANKQKTLR